jgi:hypothetical protein
VATDGAASAPVGAVDVGILREQDANGDDCHDAKCLLRRAQDGVSQVLVLRGPVWSQPGHLGRRWLVGRLCAGGARAGGYCFLCNTYCEYVTRNGL